jgi:hypothetical protein
VSIEDIQKAAEQIKAAGRSKPRAGRDPVNQPMIHHWVDAMGDKNPIYVDEAAARAAGHPGIVAPPTMIQVWTMMGLGGVREPDDRITKSSNCSTTQATSGWSRPTASRPTTDT